MDILIAEDDRVSALKLQRALEKLGHTVTVTQNGSQAWEIVRGGRVSLLISDWMMPEMDGLSLCRRVRAQPDGLYTYMILLTTRTSRDDRISGLEAGADDLLAKPFDMGELIARLNVARRILSMQEQLRAHAAQLRELHAALERQNALLAERASTDGLTGLKNRVHFDEALDAALSYSARHGHALSLIMLDVDRFKAYNDEFGHPAGDDVLRSVSDILRRNARREDVVARYGGEEFALVLPSTDTDAARILTERLRLAIAGDQWQRRAVTASFGVTTTRVPVLDAERLIKQADRALYHSKAHGRNCITHYIDLIAMSGQASESIASGAERLEALADSSGPK
jgi:diguanylate cyclase (GGDEF)-like protein